MRLKLICCDVFFRMACRAAAMSRNVIDMEFTELRSHVEPDDLRRKIQTLIDQTGKNAKNACAYDAILLGYGLCGNSTAGLTAPGGTRLVIPRAHDCCTLFLGSRSGFKEHFGSRLSAQWSSHGYLERGSDYLGGTDLGRGVGYDREYGALVEQYGEENAEYIWETLHPARHVGKDERIYIDVAPFDDPGRGDAHYKRFEAAVCGDASVTTSDAIAASSNAGVTASNAIAANGDTDVTASDTDVTASDAASATVPTAAPTPAIPPIQRIAGSTRLIDKLLDGEWDDDFLIVPPGASIAPVYDMEQILTVC